MKYHTQMRREGGKKLVLYRKFWWFTWFTRYLPHDNKRKKLEKEMSDLSEKLVKKYDEYKDHLAEHRQMHKIIDNTRGEEESRGPVVVKSLPFWPFTIKDSPEPSKLWTRFKEALEGGVATIGSTIAGVGGAQITRVNGEVLTPEKDEVEDEFPDVVIGETRHHIRPESKNQQKKQNNQQHNNQQRNN
jgi:hypothetical protein